jgi:acylphosphatase
MKNLQEARVVVSGMVQGVFFRRSTRDIATYCGVRGFVRNLPGGQVEAVIQGERSEVEKVVDFMREGPAGAVVERISVEWHDPAEAYEGFQIQY